MSPVKHIPPQMVRPAASATTFRTKDKENHTLRRSPSVNFSAPTKEASARARLGTMRKPLGPRKPTPPSSPDLRPKKSLLVEEKVAEKASHRRSRVLPERTTTNHGDKENASANTSGDSVRDRMREWERERQRLRELERIEERRREAEAEEERGRERERELEEEMKRDIERQRMLEAELDRQREREIEMERVRMRQVEALRERERQREAEALLEREREELERQRLMEVQTYHHAYPRITVRRLSGSTPPDSHPPTPLSPLIEGGYILYCRGPIVLTMAPFIQSRKPASMRLSNDQRTSPA